MFLSAINATHHVFMQGLSHAADIARQEGHPRLTAFLDLAFLSMLAARDICHGRRKDLRDDLIRTRLVTLGLLTA